MEENGPEYYLPSEEHLCVVSTSNPGQGGCTPEISDNILKGRRICAYVGFVVILVSAG